MWYRCTECLLINNNGSKISCLVCKILFSWYCHSHCSDERRETQRCNLTVLVQGRAGIYSELTPSPIWFLLDHMPFFPPPYFVRASLVAQVVKNLPATWETWVGKVPWWRACNALQDSCLENPMNRGAWWATVHGVAKSWTWLGD